MITENNQNETPREKIIFKKVKKKICERFKWLNMWITRNNEKGERKYLKKSVKIFPLLMKIINTQF